MKHFAKFLLVALALVAVTAALNACDPGWTEVHSRCYQIADEPLWSRHVGPTRSDAQYMCMRNDAELVRIETWGENWALRKWLLSDLDDPESTEAFWIDLEWSSFKGVGWVWSNSVTTSAVFTNFRDEQGNVSQECAVMSQKDRFNWAREDCSREEGMKYICERPRKEYYTPACFGKYCYVITTDEYTAKDSKCPAGYEIATSTVQPPEEYNFIKFILPKIGIETVWTAGSKDEGEWVSQGEEDLGWEFTWYLPYQPESSSVDACIFITNKDGEGWEKNNCQDKHPVLCKAVSDDENAKGCFDNKCYHITEDTSSVEDAQCPGGYKLAGIDSEEEHEFVQFILSESEADDRAPEDSGRSSIWTSGYWNWWQTQFQWKADFGPRGDEVEMNFFRESTDFNTLRSDDKFAKMCIAYTKLEDWMWEQESCDGSKPALCKRIV